MAAAKRLLITGADGFVGRYAVTAFAAAGYVVIRAGHGTDDCDVALNLLDYASIHHAVQQTVPTHVLHLAAQSFVPAAQSDPLATYEVNVLGTARLLQALRDLPHCVRFLLASSAEVYGHSALDALPLRESSALRPANPYAASKAAAEILALAARSASIEVLIARPFNHIGPGQDARFVIAGFAQQLSAIAAGGPPLLEVGNLEAERDFLDVRDVVAAYALLFDRGVDGEIYNIASGQPVAIREMLRRCILLAGVPVTVRNDPQRMRASEIPRFYGDASKLMQSLGWRPQITIDTSLAEIFAAARELAAAG